MTPTRSQLDAMRALPAAIKAANNAQPCTYCDDTGDVHSIDGEWRGRCVCPAGEYPTPSPLVGAGGGTTQGDTQ